MESERIIPVSQNKWQRNNKMQWFPLHNLRPFRITFLPLIEHLMTSKSDILKEIYFVVILQQLNNNRAWNLFTQVISMSQDIRHNRYCLRLIIKVRTITSFTHEYCI